MDNEKKIEMLQAEISDLKQSLSDSYVEYAKLRKRMAAIELENSILRGIAGIDPDEKFTI